MSQQFFPIKVSQINKTTEDCVVLTFDVTDELKNEFIYTQGQYLTLKANIKGEEIRRSYSLCSSPLDGCWKVAIKKIDEGRFSSYANDELKVGDTLEVMPPNGRFTRPISATAKNYVAFAAGSGITPILSIIKTHLAKEPESTFTLFYINQSVQSMILREEVEALKNVYLNRFELYHFLTKEQRDAPLFNGRIDKEKMQQISRLLIDISSIDDYFICGPTEMIFMIRDFLIEKGTDEKKVHFELFNTPGSDKKIKKIDDTNTDLSQIAIINNGIKTNFTMNQGGENILDAALKNHADLPFACKGGVCCTCRAKLIEGEVNMEVNYALEDEEVEQGYILTCQAVPKTKVIVVDFDS